MMGNWLEGCNDAGRESYGFKCNARSTALWARPGFISFNGRVLPNRVNLMAGLLLRLGLQKKNRPKHGRFYRSEGCAMYLLPELVVHGEAEKPP